jgi:hypothetical protein
MERVVSKSESLQTALLLVLSLGLAVWGQRVLSDRSLPLDGPFLYGLAVLLFLSVVARGRDWMALAAPSPAIPRTREKEEVGAVGTRSASLAVAALVLGAATYLFSGGNRFTVLNVSLWLAAIITFIAAFAELPVRSWAVALVDRLRQPAWSIRITWKTVAFLAILLVAIFFRYYQLDRIPAEMTSDHAEKLLDVNDVLHGIHPIFFVRNTGREAVQFYFTALLIRLFDLPVGHLALKIGTSFFGVMAIPFTYLLAKELYDDEVGLLAAALLAISQWHVAITRVGLRFPFTAAFAAPTLYFLVRGFKYNRRNDWLLSGLFLGIGLHTYTSMRVVPALLVLLAGIKLAFDLVSKVGGWRGLRRPTSDIQPPTSNPQPFEASSLNAGFWANGLLATAMALIVFLPLGRYMVDNPEVFWFRVLTRSSNLERQLPTNELAVFFDNLKNALLMFNVKGDQVWVNTVPGSPVLDPITGALFVLGMTYVLWRLLRHADRRSAYLLAGLFMLLMPSVLSIAFPQENPSVVRAGGAPVIVMIIASLPLVLAARRLRETLGGLSRTGITTSSPLPPAGEAQGVGTNSPLSLAAGELGKWVSAGLVVLVLLATARLDYDWYFHTYDVQFRQSAWNTTEMGAVVRAFATSVGDMQHAYHVAYPYWADTRNIGINAGDPTWDNAILNINQAQALVNDPAAKLFLVNPEDQRSITVLQQLFPNGDLRRYQSRTPNKDFLIFFVPKR